MDDMSIKGEGRVPNPDINLDTDWLWFWECNWCGLQSRKTPFRDIVKKWAEIHSHRC